MAIPDYNGDSRVDVADLLIFSQSYTSLVDLVELGYYFGYDNSEACLPSFPGAQGYGSCTPGGRGGQVIKVTNTQRAGPGSLREALLAQGPRIIIFDVGGTIDLTPYDDLSTSTDIYVRNPYVTIAAQTAPGDGIMIRGGAIVIATHDAIVRGLRVRTGEAVDGQLDNGNRDAFYVTYCQTCQDVGSVIVDHCSFSWGTDENSGTWGNVTNVTYQYNIVAEGLMDQGHSMGMLIGPGAQKVSIHHNLFAHNRDRVPLFGGGNVPHPEFAGPNQTEYINNVVYNVKWDPPKYSANMELLPGGGSDFYNDLPSFNHNIGNFIKRGPESVSDWCSKFFEESNLPESKIYYEGNRCEYRPDDSYDQWAGVVGTPEIHRSDELLFTPSGIIIEENAEAAYSKVLSSAGARVPSLDVVDQRIVQDVSEGTGMYKQNVSDAGGWPSLDGGTARLDSDNDGMPDDWEISYGTDPQVADDDQDLDGDGYTNIEEWINSFYE